MNDEFFEIELKINKSILSLISPNRREPIIWDD
jgi:hypothetical protein